MHYVPKKGTLSKVDQVFFFKEDKVGSKRMAKEPTSYFMTFLKVDTFVKNGYIWLKLKTFGHQFECIEYFSCILRHFGYTTNCFLHLSSQFKSVPFQSYFEEKPILFAVAANSMHFVT